MDNKAIAAVFSEIADILDIQGEGFFRVNAYRKGALTVLNLAEDLRQVVKKTPTELGRIPGIGKALKDKIIELVETGKCSFHEKLKKGFPLGLLEILKLRGLGPKKVKLFYAELGIKTVEELKKAAEAGALRGLEKMGEKSEAEILKAIEEYSQFSTERSLIDIASEQAEKLIEYMKKMKSVDKIEFCGSLRRGQETIGDIDILVTVKDKKEVPALMKYFVSCEGVINVLAEGDTKSSVILDTGMQADLRVVANESFGGALHYFTGSKEHNIRMRELAKNNGWKLNEYGVFDGDKMLAGASEEEIFEILGLPFIAPELRQDSGEIEAGLRGELPQLIELSDMKGDLHSHSNYSDGKNNILEMAEAFAARGYEYFAVTDHSSMMGVTGGMGEADIKKQWKEISELQEQVDIEILKGCEVDILKDGSLDFSDEVLAGLDVVIISAHMFNRLPAEAQTERLLRAIENNYSMILGHPSGRLIGKRAPMEFDMEKVIDACVENKVALEINSQPKRLDLAEKYVRIAKDKGAKFVINTDSHSVEGPDLMKFGVGMARRGWLEKEDVLNAGSLKDFKKFWE